MTIVKNDLQEIQVVIMVNYVHEHDFIDRYIYMCIREEASSHGLNLPTYQVTQKYVYL